MSGAAATGARAALPSVASRDLPAVTRAQMAEVDRLAIDEFGIGLPQMMEQAGSHLAEVVRLEVDPGCAPFPLGSGSTTTGSVDAPGTVTRT